MRQHSCFSFLQGPILETTTVTIRHTILTASTYPTVPQKDDQCSWEQGYLQRRSEMAHTPARHLRIGPCHACDGET